MTTTLVALYVFVVGAVIGSFLNVVIHRYPLGESVVFPPSRCPSCRTHIKWYDNIPVLSWMVLLGRCRSCKAPFSIRYPLVEAANALFYLAIFLRTGLSVVSVLLAAIVSMTIALIYIDADIQILPDVIDLPGIVVGIAIGALAPAASVDLVIAHSVRESLIGAAIGGGFLFLVAITYQFIRKVEGMGMGDVKMLAMIGATMGAKSLLPVVLIASIAGSIVGGVIALTTRRSSMQFALPFGIFLGFGLLIVLFFGTYMRDWMPFFGMPL
jgi:leader peptidase (prepilin peptidase)/N-methyltransferase